MKKLCYPPKKLFLCGFTFFLFPDKCIEELVSIVLVDLFSCFFVQSCIVIHKKKVIASCFELKNTQRKYMKTGAI